MPHAVMADLAASRRQTMIIAGLLQGAAMIALHEWFKAHGFKPDDLLWAAPAYALAVFGPLTFSLLRGEFDIGSSLRGAAFAALTVATTAGWFGWTAGAGGETVRGLGSEAGGLFIFGMSSIAAWFVALPFLQAGLRARAFAFPYARLFDDAWRNALLASNCIVFAGLFWALLGLWAGLFMVLHMEFFKDLFSSRFFIYLATTLAIGFAVSLEEREASALGALRRHLLAFQTRLLPLAVLIVILFLGALPVAGLAPLWETGHATPLMLGLQLAIVALTNAAWQDGAQPAPFSSPVQWLVRAALALLPVLSALCVWSLSLRIAQHGWSVDRVWAAILVGLTALYALGYAASALSRGWLRLLGVVNTWMALLVVASLLAVHTPLLDPRRISAGNQVARLLASDTDVERFDFNYLRFNLGRSGDEALKALAELSGHPKAEAIRAKAKEALARTNRYAAHMPPTLGKDKIAAKLKAYPAETQIPSSFVEYLHDRMSRDQFDYALNALKTSKDVPLLAIDLGAGPERELVLMAQPFLVFAAAGNTWQQIGQISFPHPLPKPEEMRKLLENGGAVAVPRQWSDMRLGDKTGALTLQAKPK